MMIVHCDGCKKDISEVGATFHLEIRRFSVIMQAPVKYDLCEECKCKLVKLIHTRSL